jgi:hypothetical protein
LDPVQANFLQQSLLTYPFPFKIIMVSYFRINFSIAMTVLLVKDSSVRLSLIFILVRAPIVVDVSHRVLGMIELISPSWPGSITGSMITLFVELFLGCFASGCYLLTELLPAVVGQLLEDRVGRIGAAVNRRNIANRKVLKKAGFERKHVFDLEQDFYEIGFH